MYHLIVLCLLLPSTTLICMDKPSLKMVSLQLDDGSRHSIAEWKVEQESNTLCKCYYSQKKQSPILVPNISSEEIELFDAALDRNISHPHPNSFSNYYDALTPVQQITLTSACGQYGNDGTKKLCALRLTAQLADKWLGHDMVNKAIIGQKSFAEKRSLFVHLRTAMIIENTHNNLTVPSPISSYNPDNCFMKRSKEGAPICMPNVNNLNTYNFNGKPTPPHATGNDGEVYDIVLFSKKHKILSLNPRRLHIGTDTAIVKTITHDSIIKKACLSPDGKWLATSSSAQESQQNSKLILTQLDMASNQYLSDSEIVSEWNFNTACCFNNTSTLFAFGESEKIHLFSLETQQTICSLKLLENTDPQLARFKKASEVNPELWTLAKQSKAFSLHVDKLQHALSCRQKGISPNFQPTNQLNIDSTLLALAFNHDDTRLVACLQTNDLLQRTVIIWDTSNLDEVKQLQLIHIPIQQSHETIITFNYPEQDTVAISTDYTTFFFDVNSGAFLGETEPAKKQESTIYAAMCSIPHSSLMCIAKSSLSERFSFINFHDSKSGKCLSSIILNKPAIMGIGMTKDSKSLVSTFDGYKSITTQLISEKDNAAIVDLAKDMGLVTFYGLLQLYKAKKENKKAYISGALFEYMQKFSEEKSYKDIIDKYLL